MGWLLIDRVHRAAHLARSTAALVFIILAPGGVLCAIAYWKWRKDHAR
jgi:hypothetical protein